MRVVLPVVVILASASSALAAESIRAGQWEMTSRSEAMAIPGMPPEIARQMAVKPFLFRRCVTDAEVKAGPRALFEASDGKCDYTRFSMKDGKLATVAVCNQPGGAMTVTSQGTYTSTSYAIKTQMTGTGKQKGTSMRSTNTGKWLGPCPARKK